MRDSTLTVRAGLVVALGAFNLNSNTVATQTVFVSNSGQSLVTNQVKIGGIYINGSLNINSSPTIDFGPNKATVLETLGLTGSSSGTASVQVGSWRIQ